jgi:exodeoxyribonuclease VII large subunit
LRLEQSRERLGYLLKALDQQHPTRQFEQLKLRLYHAYKSLLARQRVRLGEDRHRLRLCQATLAQTSPQVSITQHQQKLARLLENHQSSMRQRLLLARHQLSLHSRSLDTLSPLKTLARGFTTISKNDKLVTSVKQLSPDDNIRIRLSDGKVEATVK